MACRPVPSRLVCLLLAVRCVAAVAVVAFAACGSSAWAKPNMVVIFTDDQGYADVGVFGATDFKTPNLDRMSSQGMRFTDFYAAPICSASRAALLTGCYPGRVGIRGAIFPKDKHGLSPDEITIAEVLRDQGYATACIGKWHLGHTPQMLPTGQGFDVFFGLPYSNDMNGKVGDAHGNRVHNVPLMDGMDVVEQPADQATLTRRYTERALQFIADHEDQPFFIYLAHTMPHTPLATGEPFAGRTVRPYGDVIEEIDWSVGQVLDALEQHGLADNTLVIFTSDNGPPTWKDEAIRGSTGPLRGGKQSTLEGGMRVPMIAWWPGTIPAGTETQEVASTMDFLPTFAKLVGGTAPDDRVIDGKDIWPLLSGQPGATTPHNYFFYLGWGDRMDAVRSGQWKLHVPYKTWKTDDGKKHDKPVTTELRLYDLSADIGEQHNVAASHPEVVSRLLSRARAFEQELKTHGRSAGYFIYSEAE